MTPTIPVHMEEVPSVRDRYRNKMTFVIPSLESEFSIEFVPSKTGTALKRLMAIIDMEIAGADKNSILEKLETFVKPGVNGTGRTMSADELAEYRRENGWTPRLTLDDIMDDPLVAAPVSTPEDIYRQAVETLQPAPVADNAPVVTSDGRYIVDPVARTIEPVADIPADIVAVMPIWVVEDDTIAYEPRQFDIAPGMEKAFQIEHDAATALLTELGGIIFGAVPRDLKVDKNKTSVELVDGGAFFTVAA